jgi:AcrR family transcriptional regulator
MDEIAARAQVEKANIYYYFEGKEQLYRALFDRLVGELASHADELAAFDDFDSALVALIDVMFNTVERYQHIVGLVLHEMLNSTTAGLGPLMARLEGRARQLLARGMKKGEVVQGDPGQIVISIAGILLGYFMMPAERSMQLTGKTRFTREALDARKDIALGHIRRILAP